MIFILLFTVVNIYSQDSTLTKRADSLILLRNQQYQEYQTKISSFSDSSLVSLKSMLLAKDSLLNIDQQILDELFPEMRETIDSAATKLEMQEAEFSSQIKKYDWVDRYSSYFIPASLVLGVVILLLLTLVISFSLSKKKWRKQWTQISKEHAKTMDELTQIRNNFEQEEKELSIQKQWMEKEKKTIQSENSALTASLEDLRNKCTQLEDEIKQKDSMLVEKGQMEVKLNELKAFQDAFEKSEQIIRSLEQEKKLSEQRLLKDLSDKEKVIIELQQEMIVIRDKMGNSEVISEHQRLIEEFNALRSELNDVKEKNEKTLLESEEKIKYLQTLADEERSVRKEMEQVIKDFLTK